MIQLQDKSKSREKRRKRIRGKVSGSATTPRLSVYRSEKHIYAQLIDDDKGVTLVHSSTIAKGLKLSGKKVEEATLVGEDLAKKALKKGLKKVVFDRGGYVYTGRVKALADGARNEGLEF